jgi:hypothetical protein
VFILVIFNNILIQWMKVNVQQSYPLAKMSET